MIQSNINNQSFQVEFEKDGKTGTVNGSSFTWDLLPITTNRFNILRNNRSYTIIIESREPETNSLVLRINGKKLSIQTKYKMALLLESMGLSAISALKVNEVKAPMPGLVLRALVEAGDQVKKGDSLLVLEAMKMENVIKSPVDAEIAKIVVKQGQAVEKNQVLIQFV
jgi:biotin carboxyl carrier protein